MPARTKTLPRVGRVTLSEKPSLAQLFARPSPFRTLPALSLIPLHAMRCRKGGWIRQHATCLLLICQAAFIRRQIFSRYQTACCLLRSAVECKLSQCVDSLLRQRASELNRHAGHGKATDTTVSTIFAPIWFGRSGRESPCHSLNWSPKLGDTPRRIDIAGGVAS